MGFEKLLFPYFAMKPADQTVIGNTLTDDTEFQFNVEAGKKYKIFASMYGTMDLLGGGGMDITLNGSCSITNMRVSARSQRATAVQGTGTALTALGQLYSLSFGIIGQGDVLLSGVIEINAGGTLKLQFAETNSVGAGCTLFRDSEFELMEL